MVIALYCHNDANPHKVFCLRLPVLEKPCKHGHKTSMQVQAAEAYRQVSLSVAKAAEIAGRPALDVSLVVVSKTQTLQLIEPVLQAGHRIFGENRVQEAAEKWPSLRKSYPAIELHLIGPLQSNKAAEAVALFDVIETVDRDKIAAALAVEIKKQGRTPRLLVQVNTGKERQKAGVDPDELPIFIEKLRNVHGLTIDGLMCIPPINEPPAKHFTLLRKLAAAAKLTTLSMGMSADFVEAIAEGATHVRIGSAIFGARPVGSPDKAG